MFAGGLLCLAGWNKACYDFKDSGSRQSRGGRVVVAGGHCVFSAHVDSCTVTSYDYKKWGR